MLCRWTRGMRRPARTLAHVAPFLQRVLARPATQRVLVTEKLQPPWV
jgi:glutathione S-transferase